MRNLDSDAVNRMVDRRTFLIAVGSAGALVVLDACQSGGRSGASSVSPSPGITTTIVRGKKDPGGCEGVCPYRPYLVVPMQSGDTGARPSTPSPALGPDSPSVWFETYDATSPTGNQVAHPQIGGEYRIAVRVANLGNAPAVGLNVDYLEWTTTTDSGHLYTFAKGLVTRGTFLADGDMMELCSPKWVPRGHDNGTPGDVIVRVFDVFDAYLDTGYDLRVTNDRHLAHHFL